MDRDLGGGDVHGRRERVIGRLPAVDCMRLADYTEVDSTVWDGIGPTAAQKRGATPQIPSPPSHRQDQDITISENIAQEVYRKEYPPSSLGWIGFLDPISPPISSMARLEMTCDAVQVDNAIGGNAIITTTLASLRGCFPRYSCEKPVSRFAIEGLATLILLKSSNLFAISTDRKECPITILGNTGAIQIKECPITI
jgi:hypothetical protein